MAQTGHGPQVATACMPFTVYLKSIGGTCCINLSEARSKNSFSAVTKDNTF